MNPQMQAAAMQGALTGERPTRTVTFPTTGDLETDFIAGILQLQHSDGPTTSLSPEAAARVLRYLADRYEAIAREFREAQKNQWEMWKGQLQQAQQQPPPTPWYTGTSGGSLGGLGYPYDIASLAGQPSQASSLASPGIRAMTDQERLEMERAVNRAFKGK